MFYILSRFFACTASPWLYILILLLIGCFTDKRKIKLLCLFFSLFLLLFFSNRVIYQACLNSYTYLYISEFKSTGHYKYALLPGGITGYDNHRKRVEYGFAVDRMVDAIELYKLGKVEILVFTGDGASMNSGNRNEFLKQLESVWEVKGEDVIIEPNAKNTFQNIEFSMKLLPDMNSENTIVINSAIYMKRTLQSCRQLDFYPAYYATDITVDRKYSWEDWIPDFHVMDDWMRLIHEWIGCVAYKIL